MLHLKLLVRAAPSQENTAMLHSAKGLFCSVPAEHEHFSPWQFAECPSLLFIKIYCKTLIFQI